MAPLLMAGLSVLPEIPKLWGAVAGIFGKKVPESVESAAGLAGDVMGLVQGGQVTPEQSILLETRIMEHKETILQKQNERAEIERKARADEIGATVQLMGQGLTSQDAYVARTRPKILRDLFATCAIYSLACTILIVIMAIMKVPKATLDVIISLMQWFGAAAWGTFTTAFVGYTTARSIDKRNPETKEQKNMIGKLVKAVL